MTKLALTFAALFVGSVPVSNLLAQGQFTWGNDLQSIHVRAHIYGLDPNNPTEVRTGNTALGRPAGTETYAGPLLAGTGFTVAIYLGNDAASTVANISPPDVLGTSSFRTGAGAGLMFQLTGADSTRPGGAEGVHYQFRVWDNQGGTVTSWADLMAHGGSVASAASDVYVFATALGGGGTILLPPYTSDLRSFQLTQVPEPRVIALGAFGLGALLFRFRKQGGTRSRGALQNVERPVDCKSAIQ